ncbi:MAG: phosphoribosylamine--glycine ligase [Sphingosinicella sp.]
MNVLLIGAGGREHALAWKLAQSPLIGKLYAAPGNPGIAHCAELVSLDAADHRAVVDFCRRHALALVMIGPEVPLVDGLADNLRVMGVPVFGPGKQAAMLEGSKGFTKDLCARAGIPTARYLRASDRMAAEAALGEFGFPAVIKADGLAAGKGVVIAESPDDAERALDAMFGGDFGEGGDRGVVIEEYMHGEEVSFFALVDGETVLPFGSAQDHKRIGEGDSGPNTGGMGAYSPASIFTAKLERRVIDEIVRPTLAALAESGTRYSGLLYAGLMLTADGPKLVEYNVRFGDPECQALMLRLDSDLLELAAAAAGGTLADCKPPRFAKEASIVVVIAAKGYPGEPKRGGRIEGLDRAEAEGALVFQAGTALSRGHLSAAGGRVLNVSARAPTLKQAQRIAYRAADAVHYPGGYFRRDIGWRELKRLQPGKPREKADARRGKP